MLTSKQALNKIKRFYNKSWFSEHDDIIEFGVDTEDKTYYNWNFQLDSKKYQIRCNKENGAIEVL